MNIKKTQKTKQTVLASGKRKEMNRRLHGKEEIPFVAERNKIVLAQDE